MKFHGTAASWAIQLDLTQAARLLEQTLNEEKKTDAVLNKLAEAHGNKHAEAAWWTSAAEAALWLASSAFSL
jgi:ferritin-like metal-binding protein YciE